VQALIAGASKSGGGLLASLIGTVTLLAGATSVFAELQADLDRIWRTPRRTRSGVRSLARTRLASFGTIVVSARC